MDEILKKSFFVVGFVCIGITIGCFIDERVVINNESIVLVFVGILATFVVVGNYAQVLTIKNDFSKNIEELSKEFSLKIQEIKKYDLITDYMKNNKIQEQVYQYKINIKTSIKELRDQYDRIKHLENISISHALTNDTDAILLIEEAEKFYNDYSKNSIIKTYEDDRVLKEFKMELDKYRKQIDDIVKSDDKTS